MRKQAAAEAEGLRWQLDKKDVEILELKKNVKARIEDLSHYKVFIVPIKYSSENIKAELS